MKKWYTIQFAIVITIIVLTFASCICLEVLTGLQFKYKTQVFTIEIWTLVLSGTILLLTEFFKKN